jgi:Zn-dependent protease with chaperone function
MDFFQQQDKARRNTGLLALYFFLAIALIAIAVNTVFYFFFKFTELYPYTPSTWFSDSVWMYVTGATFLVILSGSLFRFFALVGGGRSVANMVAAIPVNLNSHITAEKQYINVVEEMSIASGVPMPELYIMNKEQGINAFVAGYKSTEAVMVVTQGALEQLTRDELQGVVGHEFSHILNGDMRINIRLMAILAGILSIGQIGRFLLRGGSRTQYRRNSKDNGQGALIVLAIALLVIGYIGLFFGRLIKAAISRQREFLADASAVQFTRNPKGIAGALNKIKESISGAFLASSHAEDMSHMCFGETQSISFSDLLSTHPPLNDRINAIDPSFLKIEKAKNIINKRKQSDVPENSMGFSADEAIHTDAQKIANSVGNPTAEHMLYAVAIHENFSSSLMGFVHSSDGAKAIVYILLMDSRDTQQELNILNTRNEMNLIDQLGKEVDFIKKLGKRQRLPLIDLLLPSLKKLSNADLKEFLLTIEAVIRADKKFTLFEFVLLTILKQHLRDKTGYADKIKYYSFKPVVKDIQLILSVLAHCSAQSDDRKQASYQRCLQSFTLEPLPMLPMKGASIKSISRALNQLNLLSFLLKKSVLEACADTILDDGIIMPAEAELLRAVAETLGCPMPPLLPEHTA